MSTVNLISDGVDEEHAAHDIVFAVLEDGEALLNVSEVGNEISDHVELAGDLISETFKPEINSMAETGVTKTRFFRQFLDRVFDSVDNPDSVINDTAVTCGVPGFQEIVRVPALLLASVSPVFKAAGVSTEAENQALILPDANANDFRVFLRHLCSYQLETLNVDKVKDNDTINIILTEKESVIRIMDLLCVEFRGSDDPVDSLFLLDHDWVDREHGMGTAETGRIFHKPPDQTNENKPPKRRPGRKPGRKSNVKSEPYIKTEVMETFRTTEASYSLRQTIKRKRFADLAIESELDSDSDDDNNIVKDNLKTHIDDYLKEDSDVYVPDFEEEEEEDLLDEADDESAYFEESFQDQQQDQQQDNDEEEEEGDVIFYQEAEQQIEMGEPSQEEEEAPSLFSVFFASNGQVEIVKSDREKPSFVRRIVSVTDDAVNDNDSAKNQESTVHHPRSLLKQKRSKVPLILVCSACNHQSNGQTELKRHVAKSHPGSKLFRFSASNPHRDCVPCSALMQSYEKTFAENDEAEIKNICLPCPHCRRRYLGNVGSLATHLMTDHRQAVDADLQSHEESYFHVIGRADPKVTTCDFCNQLYSNTVALNKHLLTCPSNVSGHSAGLFCHICGKMFAQTRMLKDHLLRHGEENIVRPRNFFCPECPVACVTELNLSRHKDREHSEKNFDQNFVLHRDCQRCTALYNSYLDNITTQTIPFRDMVFKCPHCHMILYGNQKHPPRYLYNHVSKFHMDREVNDFTISQDEDSAKFRLRSKQEEETLTCDFCSFKSKTRANHNVHLSTCKANTVPCRPGYMCDLCGFVAGTGVHLRNHLESHNDKKAYSCSSCNYTGRSRRYLKQHILKHHSKLGSKNTTALLSSCPKCGKVRRDGGSMRSHLKKCGTGCDKIPCSRCDLDFKRREDMEAHALIHEGQVLCPIHNILFREESEVYLHVNMTGPEDKVPRLQCCICPAHFRHMCLFMKHLRRHLNISPYRCQLCSKQLNTFASLGLHMRRIHSQHKEPQAKTFACELCLKTFGTKGHLKEHIQGVHDQSRITLCPICQKSFRTDKRMKKHLYNSHPDAAPHFRRQNKLETFILEPVFM